MENPRRQLIQRYIEQNPGVRFHGLKRALGLPHGVLVHHLRVLREKGLLVFQRDGRSLRLRLPWQRLGAPMGPETRPLIDLVEQHPGLTIQEACDALGWSRRVTAYRVRALQQVGMLSPRPEGRVVRLLPGRIRPPSEA